MRWRRCSCCPRAPTAWSWSRPQHSSPRSRGSCAARRTTCGPEGRFARSPPTPATSTRRCTPCWSARARSAATASATPGPATSGGGCWSARVRPLRRLRRVMPRPRDRSGHPGTAGELAATVADLADAVATRDPGTAAALVDRACEQEGTLVDVVEAVAAGETLLRVAIHQLGRLRGVLADRRASSARGRRPSRPDLARVARRHRPSQVHRPRRRSGPHFDGGHDRRPPLAPDARARRPPPRRHPAGAAHRTDGRDRRRPDHRGGGAGTRARRGRRPARRHAAAGPGRRPRPPRVRRLPRPGRRRWPPATTTPRSRDDRGRPAHRRRAGVTTVRDLGDRDYLSLRLREAARTDRTLPTIVASGPPITTPGGHCHYLGGASAGIEGCGRGPRARRARRRRHQDHGERRQHHARQPRPSPRNSPPDELAPRSTRRTRTACRSSAHAHGLEAVRDGVAAGVDGLEHVTLMTADGVDPLPDDLVAPIVARRRSPRPTLGLVAGRGCRRHRRPCGCRILPTIAYVRCTPGRRP